MDQENAISPAESRTEVTDPQFQVAAKLFDRFLGALAALVSGQLYLPVEAQPCSAEQRSLAAVFAADEDDGCVLGLTLEPLPGLAYLSLGRGFVSSMVEILLGAPLAFAGQPRESLTELDLHVLDGLFDAAIEELQKVWTPVCKAAFVRVSTELGREVSLVGAESQRVVVLSAELRVNDRPDRMRLILPSSMARMADQPGSRRDSARGEGRALLAEALTFSTVDVQAVLKGSDIRFRDLLRLRTGMVLALPQKAGTPVECHVNGVPKFRGEMVRRGRGAAMQVQCLLSAETDQSLPE